MKQIFVACFLPLLAGCSQISYVGNSTDGYKGWQRTPISIEKAIHISGPYVENIFQKKVELGQWPSAKEVTPKIWVLEDDNYFYIAKSNVPVKLVQQYVNYSVKVDKYTGQIVAVESE